MKKTKYFLSGQVVWRHANEAKDQVIVARDEFLKANASIIEEIIDEDIKFETCPAHQGNFESYIIALLRLTYFEKSK